MDALSNYFIDFLRQNDTPRNIFVGFSGGLDSHVLLHLVAQCRSLFSGKISVIHVNHGVHPQADQWQAHCHAVVEKLQLDFFSEKVSHVPKNDLENQLREARYHIFSQYLQENDWLLVAHQQNDQAETVLLQMLRGAGPKGLSAMPVIKPFAAGFLVRPLLPFSREAVLQYAIQHRLTWIEDDSNQNIQFQRNFLRRDIFPALKNRWPKVEMILARVASHCAEQEKLLTNYVLQDLIACAGSKANTLSVEKIMQFDALRRKHILRAWIVAEAFQLPSEKKLRTITQTILTAGVDRQPYLSWRDIEMRRYRDDLYLMKKLAPHNASQIIPGEKPGTTIRFRQGGEKIQLPGRAYRHCLKKIFQARGIPPWLRDRVPLLYDGDQLVEIIHFFE